MTISSLGFKTLSYFFHLSYIFFEFCYVKIVISFIFISELSSLACHDQLKNNTFKKNLFKNIKLIFLKN